MSTQDVVTRGIANFDLYPYVPSATAGWAFVVLFSIGAVVHFIYLFPLRTWFFIPFVLGCIGEAFGYYGRAWSHRNIRNGSPYLLQLMLILGSAPLLAATVYMTLGRLVRALEAEKHVVLSTRWTTKIYVVIDIGSFACQILGSATQASGDPNGIRTGKHVVMGGLAFQLFTFICFIGMTALLHLRLNRAPTSVSENPLVPWRRYLRTIVGVSTLISIRSAYRLIEFATGNSSPLATKEVFLYTFDAFLMFLVVVSLALVHPGQLMRAVRKLNAASSVREDSALVPILR